MVENDNFDEPTASTIPEEIWRKQKKETQEALGETELYGCIMPNGYCVDNEKVYKLKMVGSGKNRDLIPVPICDVLVMVTGKYRNAEGINVVEVTFQDGDLTRVEIVPQSAILIKKDFQEHLVKKNLQVTEPQIRDVINFFSVCVAENEKAQNTTFKKGEAYVSVGWKDNYTKFVTGNRMYFEENEKFTSTPAVFMNSKDTDIEKYLEIRGDLSKWVDAVRPFIVHTPVRFGCYFSFASMLLGLLHVNPSIFCYSCRTSQGKTTAAMVSASQTGNPDDENDSLLITGMGASKAGLQVVGSDSPDLPVYLDEISQMPEEVREYISYIFANSKQGPKSTPDKKKRRDPKLKSNVIATGEISFLTDKITDGAEKRVCTYYKPPLPDMNPMLIKRCKKVLSENYGHILPLFLEKLFQHKDEVVAGYEAAVVHLSKIKKESERKADYYAAALVSGWLLEMVYKDIGLEMKNPQEVVEYMWKECEDSEEYEPLCVRVLRAILGYVTVEQVDIIDEDELQDGDIPEVKHDVGGWFSTDRKTKVRYLDLVQGWMEQRLKRDQFSNLKDIYRQWYDAGVLETDGKKQRKGWTKNIRHRQPKTGNIEQKQLMRFHLPNAYKMIGNEGGENVTQSPVEYMQSGWSNVIPESETPGNKPLVDPVKDHCPRVDKTALGRVDPNVGDW